MPPWKFTGTPLTPEQNACFGNGNTYQEAQICIAKLKAKKQYHELLVKQISKNPPKLKGIAADALKPVIKRLKAAQKVVGHTRAINDELVKAEVIDETATPETHPGGFIGALDRIGNTVGAFVGHTLQHIVDGVGDVVKVVQPYMPYIMGALVGGAYIGAAIGSAEAGGEAAAGGGAVSAGGSVAAGGGSATAVVGGGAVVAGGSVAAGGGGSAAVVSGAGAALSTASGWESDVSDVYHAGEALFGGSGGVIAFFGRLLSLISTTMKGISDVAEEINNNIITRFVTPITETINTFKSLEEIIKGDISEGIEGIIKIPGQIAESLTNEAVILHRTAISTLEGQKHIVESLLLPSFSDIASSGLSDIKDVIEQYTKPPETPLDNDLFVNLAEPPEYLGFISKAESFIDNMKNDKSWSAQLVYLAIQAMYILPVIGQSILTAETQLRQNIKAKNPLELLGIGDIVTARIRGEISEEQAEEEALKHGLDPTRLELLQHISLALLDTQSIVQAYFRDILSPVDAGDQLQKRGFTDEQISVLYELHFHLPQPNEAMVWFARTGLSQEDLDGILRRNGLTGDQIALFKEAAYTPASGRIINASSSRIEEVEKGYLSGSMGTKVPDFILQQYDKNLLSHEQAEIDWMNHFDDLSLSDWTSAYFRKKIPFIELQQALKAHALPSELTDMYIEVSRELIPIWLIPGLYKTGQVSPEQSIAMLQKLGLDDTNVKIMSAYGEALKDQDKATTIHKLHELSKANLDKLYSNGIINKSEYIRGLEDHGYAKEDALLLLDLLEIKEELQLRQDLAGSIIAEVNSGAITKEAGIEKLYSKGFSEDEINKYKIKLHRDAVIKYKTPGEAELSKMLHAKIITPLEWIEAMKAHGYSLKWAEKLYELEEFETL